MDETSLKQLMDSLKFCAVKIELKSGVEITATCCANHIRKLGKELPVVFRNEHETEIGIFDLVFNLATVINTDQIDSFLVVEWQGLFYLDGSDDAM